MHNEIIYSDGIACKERSSFHLKKSESSGTGVKSTDGKMPDYVASLKDVSKRKTSIYKFLLRKAHGLEQRMRNCINGLKKDKSKAQQYLDIANIILLVLDLNGNVSFINRKGAATLGRSVGEINGKNWIDNFLPEYERERVNDLFLRWVAGESNPSESFESTIIISDGEERIVEWNNTVLRDDEGKIINILSSGNDITDRKRTGMALQESLEKIKRFTYFVSHDLKNPAISLIGLARCLKRKYENVFDDKGKMICNQIMTTSEQINLLVENINCFVSTTESRLCFDNIDLNETCSTIKEEYSVQLMSRGICLSICKPFTIVKADKISIIRIIRNLIDNSLKYGGNKLDTIEIGYVDSGDMHIISVKDNGEGFNEKEKENIFTAFTRDTTSGDVYGTGLGLAIVREIAERHGGRAWAEPAPGQGVTFYISISKNLY